MDEIINNMSYRLQFIDSARFMVRSLSNFVNNISEGIQKIKSKHRQDDKKLKICRMKLKYWEFFLEYIRII